MPIAVADSSPIILLSKIGHLQLLGNLFDRVLVPDGVRAELSSEGEQRPGSRELADFGWIEIRSVRTSGVLTALLEMLGPGEAHVIALAQELEEPATLLLDDLEGRRYAEAQGLVVLGTGGVLVTAKELGLISAVGPLLQELEGVGLYLSETIRARLLVSAGEAG